MLHFILFAVCLGTVSCNQQSDPVAYPAALQLRPALQRLMNVLLQFVPSSFQETATSMLQKFVDLIVQMFSESDSAFHDQMVQFLQTFEKGLSVINMFLGSKLDTNSLDETIKSYAGVLETLRKALESYIPVLSVGLGALQLATQ